MSNIVNILAGLETFENVDLDFKLSGSGCAVIDADLRILVDLKGLVDFSREKA